MFIGIFMFLILIAMGRLIAFLGDRIGSKVGKKRMTLFGLRPKYTSVIVTIISGILISFFTIAVLAVVNENVRVALFGLSKLQNEMQDLNQEIKVKNRELEKGKLQLEARNKEYEDVNRKAEETSKRLDEVEGRVSSWRVSSLPYSRRMMRRKPASSSPQKTLRSWKRSAKS